MDQEKIGNFIKEIRKKYNLTQASFAKEFGVTYQAVSKWENGKNVPDIEILKLMCEKYDKDINEFLTGTNKKKQNKLLILVIIVVIVGVIVGIIILLNNRDKVFEFKTLSATCNEYTVNGSIAYDNNKSSIYISNIDLCENNDIRYVEINCILYETSNNIDNRIDEYNYEGEAIKLDEFLKDMSFHVDNYSRVCKEYKEGSLYILIYAKDTDGNSYTHKIPLAVEENCNG